MNIKYSFRIAFRGLKTNKVRSFLTILGIVIGITSIIVIVSLGQGAQNLILSQIQAMGSKIIAVDPGREPKGMADAMEIMFSDSLKAKDLDLLKQKSNVPHLSKIMPIVMGAEVVSYGGQNYRFSFLGATSLIAQLYDIQPLSGEFFDEEDIASNATVAVVGSKVRSKLFGASDGVGEKIKIKDRIFKVVAILPEQGKGTLANYDDIIIIPYTTAQQYLLGIKYFNEIVIEVDSEENVDAAIADIKATLRASHNIQDPSKDDFYIQTSAGIAEKAGVVTGILTLFLVAVASVSLIVGGVGIMNIVLVSVTERTREIGLRKALGATKKDILMQFLFESMLLTGSGGIIGVFFGTLLSFIVSLVLTKLTGSIWKFSFPYNAAFLGFLVSALVGFIFGVYPARKASQLNPIDALRYE